MVTVSTRSIRNWILGLFEQFQEPLQQRDDAVDPDCAAEDLSNFLLFPEPLPEPSVNSSVVEPRFPEANGGKNPEHPLNAEAVSVFTCSPEMSSMAGSNLTVENALLDSALPVPGLPDAELAPEILAESSRLEPMAKGMRTVLIPEPFAESLTGVSGFTNGSTIVEDV